MTAIAGLAPLAQRVQATSNCTMTNAPSGLYTVTACISVPASGAILAGKGTVTATFTYTGTPPSSPVQRAVFYLGGTYLLTDYSTPFTFTLDSSRFADASTTLEVEGVMRETPGWTSDRATIPVTLDNGQVSPPPNNNTFTPSTDGWSGSGPIVVAATGDGAGGEPDATSVSNRIAGWNPDVMLYLGDVYETGAPMEFDNWYGGPTVDYGRFKSITNPTVGNHEYIGTTAPGYTYYWDNVPHYYSYNIGSWHFISLDSTGTGQFNQTLSGSPQVDWLAADLAANTSTCTLAYFHHPVYSIGPQGNTPRLNLIWSMLADAGVDIVLTGHDHDYQRWVPLDGTGTPATLGITEFVVGTGGHGIQNFTSSNANVAAQFGTTPNALGALKLSLVAGSAGYQFINTAGSVLDSGNVSCGTVPGIPTGATASAGNASAFVSWTAPPDMGGSPITGYTAKSSPGNKTCSTVGVLNCTVTGLTNGTSYTFTVTATNGLGTGSPSSPSNAVTPATVPGAPTGAVGQSRDGGAQISWAAPSSNGGKPITGYMVTSSPGGHTCATTGGLSCLVGGLTNDTSYTFTVKATNAIGTGPASSASSPVVPAPLVLRYYGANRFATAAAISANTFSPGVAVAYVANAYAFPDALAGAAAAGTIKGPVLLANSTGALDPATIAELTRLNPVKIIVLGGTGVISDAVKTALVPYASSSTVLRYYGANRFATAAAISA
ncbi:MAG: fibronectin type III domain-containing protein, partial [Chloroflexota bacterium]